MAAKTTTARRTRAPRHTLSREAIIERATALMDEAGPEALTMRSLATELGVGAMALYTYFRSKDELLDAVRDHVMGLLGPAPARGTWEERLRSYNIALYRLLAEHPVLTHLFATRPLAGHEAADATNAQLQILREAGFDREAAAHAHMTLLLHVLGAASWDLHMNAARQDPESRRRMQRQLESMSADRYPTLVDLAPELVQRAWGERQFAYGLDVILRGLRAQRRTSTSR